MKLLQKQDSLLISGRPRVNAHI